MTSWKKSNDKDKTITHIQRLLASTRGKREDMTDQEALDDAISEGIAKIDESLKKIHEKIEKSKSDPESSDSFNLRASKRSQLLLEKLASESALTESGENIKVDHDRLASLLKKVI